MLIGKAGRSRNILRAGGPQVKVIHPDEKCLTAFASVGSTMSPARAPAAKAGRAQGRRLVEEWWLF